MSGEYDTTAFYTSAEDFQDASPSALALLGERVGNAIANGANHKTKCIQAEYGVGEYDFQVKVLRRAHGTNQTNVRYEAPRTTVVLQDPTGGSIMGSLGPEQDWSAERNGVRVEDISAARAIGILLMRSAVIGIIGDDEHKASGLLSSFYDLVHGDEEDIASFPVDNLTALGPPPVVLKTILEAGNIPHIHELHAERLLSDAPVPTRLSSVQTAYVQGVTFLDAIGMRCIEYTREALSCEPFGTETHTLTIGSDNALSSVSVIRRADIDGTSTETVPVWPSLGDIKRFGALI